MKPFYEQENFRLSRFVAAGLFVVLYCMGHCGGWTTIVATLTLADWRVKL